MNFAGRLGRSAHIVHPLTLPLNGELRGSSFMNSYLDMKVIHLTFSSLNFLSSNTSLVRQNQARVSQIPRKPPFRGNRAEGAISDFVAVPRIFAHHSTVTAMGVGHFSTANRLYRVQGWLQGTSMTCNHMSERLILALFDCWSKQANFLVVST